MRHNIFKIRKLGDVLESRDSIVIPEEPTVKKDDEINEVRQSMLSCNQKMVQLMTLFERIL
jgi:hypothetical protein